MAYERLNKSDGEIFNASDVTHMEDGIVQNESDVTEVKNDLTYMDFYITSQSALNNTLTSLDERVTALEKAAGITSTESPMGTEPGPEENPDDDGDGDDDGTVKEEPGIVIPDDGGNDEPDDGDDGDTKTAPGPEETTDD